MSGHSKWATIKHKKGAADAKRGKVFSKIIKEITVAARMGGGDIDGNPRLRKAVGVAKSNAMPADNIKRAIQRGTGEIEGVSYEEILYEGTGPGGTLFMVEVMTDNKNRTVAEIRKVFERHGGALGAGSSAQWAFDRKGTILVPKAAATEDQIMEIAIGAGGEDYTDEGEAWQVVCPLPQLDVVASALEKAGIPPTESTAGYIPKNKKAITGREAERCLSLYETLDDHDDSQNVFADFEISDAELQRIAEAAG
ncbi:MAG: YebC/PmpR family DNA-binding transcriptional regulator [Polyangiaceae bacterium]|nr:YebC/PmpR family DNA-binding transcriptional regulator [Polyangiaceae bacterium]